MRKITIFGMALVTFFMISGVTSTVSGQENQEKEQQEKPTKKKSKLGSFIRKAGEAATGINMSNETFVGMNIEAQQLVNMEVVSCIGDSQTGKVMLTLAVKAKKDGVKTGLGKPCGSGNQECVTGYDAKGNAYEGQEVGTFTEVSIQKENPAGVPVRYQFGFSAIPPALQALEVVQVEFYIYSSQGGSVGSSMSKIEPIQVRNIPIEWDVKAE